MRLSIRHPIAITTLLFASVLGARVASAQVPSILTEQGRLFDATTGMPVTGSMSFQFAIYGAATGGTALWTET